MPWLRCGLVAAWCRPAAHGLERDGNLITSDAREPVTPAIAPPPPRPVPMERKLSLRIRQNLLERLQALAAASGTDTSSAARHLLQQALERVEVAA